MSEFLFPSSFVIKGEDYDVSGFTKAGEKHDGIKNEDTILAVRDLAMIADGSSSTEEAKQASEAAVLYLADRLGGTQTNVFRATALMYDAIGDAGNYVKANATGSRTTILVIQIVHLGNKKEEAVFGNVGDSKGILKREGNLTYVTTDHSLLQAYKTSAEERARIQTLLDDLDDEKIYHGLYKADKTADYFFERRNWVEQILGVKDSLLPKGLERHFFYSPQIRPNITTLSAQPGDIFGGVSDGVTDPCTREHIAYALDTRISNMAESIVRQSDHPSAAFRYEGDDASAIIFWKK